MLLCALLGTAAPCLLFHFLFLFLFLFSECRQNRNRIQTGHRFWDEGFWKSHLMGRPYHISALFVVDLPAFARVGDTIRAAYQGMAPDENSLQNLDQDLPNYLSVQGVPLASLPAKWLYCEAWCAPAVKVRSQ